MSIDDADDLTESLKRKWDREHSRDFVGRMERKMHRKERRLNNY